MFVRLTFYQRAGWVLTLSKTSPCQSFENTGKGEIARNEQFLLFHSVFYLFGEPSAVFIKFNVIVCKLFQFGRV